MATWTEEIVSAFQELGGISRYKELYSYFSSKNIKDYNAKKDGAAQIRGAIESHSRASEVFQKKSSNYKNNPSNDLFTPIGNLGDGFWGLNTSLTSDIKLDLTSVFLEGSQKKIYTTKYERNPKNRAIAIKVHGYNCAACDFNFSDVYGDLGDKFIEIHHIIPLHSLNEAVFIDPKLDLIPLCSNCHRMIHRNKNNVLSVNELKLLISRKD